MRKIARRLTALLTVMLLLISCSAAVYADTYHDLRDDEIELLLPDSWACDEIDKDLSEGMSYEWIVEAYDGTIEDSDMWLELYYMHDFIGGVEEYSITEAEDAMEYFDLYGKAALETLYEELDWGGTVEIGTPLFYDGEMSSQLMVPVEGVYGDGSDFYNLIFLDCETDYEAQEDGSRAVVHMIKMKRAEKKKPEQKWKERKSADRDFSRKSPGEAPKKAMISEERYMESLRTLRRSGILTKEEMQDMLERHERNRGYKRSK